MKYHLFPPALMALALGACTDGAILDIEPPLALSIGDPCDPDVAVDDCPGDPEDDPLPPPTIIGIQGDTRLWEGAGDPHPGSPGVWLGSGVTPTACTSGLNSYNDKDGDGFKDSCEYAIARSFAPYLQFSPGEVCGNGEPAWTVRYKDDVVRIAYMMAYYLDCGDQVGMDPIVYIAGTGGHAGDSEIVTVEVAYRPEYDHWHFYSMWTSAHHGTLTQASDRTLWTETTFPVKEGAFPMVWVALKKHANYRSYSACKWTIGGVLVDNCGNASWDRYRFPVDPQRNTEIHGDVSVGCFTTTVNTGTYECFTGSRKFAGWMISDAHREPDDGVTPYGWMLSYSGYLRFVTPEWPSGGTGDEDCFDTPEGVTECVG